MLDEAQRLYDAHKFLPAFDIYRSLAERGNTECQVFLGWMYYRGQGVPKNDQKAEEWIARAANSGDIPAVYSYGNFSNNRGDYMHAKLYYQRAAAAGYSPALYQLGVMYLRGLGVENRDDVAFEYFDNAARQGHIFARRERSLMLVRGYRGILFVPMGLVGLLASFIVGIRTVIKDPYSEKTIT